MGLAEALVFSIKYNLRWQRLLYILGLTVVVHVLIDGPHLPRPLWYIPCFYGCSWVAVVSVDAVLKRIWKNWP